MPVISRLTALEILDSRGRPTVQTSCELESGARATVSVPSGASTGASEAHELRDGDPSRYGGLGCRKAVGNVETELNGRLRGMHFEDQVALDVALIEIDGTEAKSRLGANAVLSVSLAFAVATAVERGVPPYEHFAEMTGQTRGSAGTERQTRGSAATRGQTRGSASTGDVRWLPRPTINLFSGGKHAGGQMEVQDVLVVANGARTIDEALSMTSAVFQSAARIIRERYGMRLLVADEGGLAPDFPSVEAAFDLAVEAIESAGLRPGEDLSLCVDVAASHFFEEGRYLLGGDSLTAEQLIGRIGEWVDRYPIVSVEDGLSEDDWERWPLLRAALGERALTLGDDFLTTNPGRIERAVQENAANALLLKVNQIGTLTEAATALRMARDAGWAVVVSARSGETEDAWLSDLAVGWGGDALKVGSITRSERLAKWNRLLAIEKATGLPVVGWPV